MRWLQRQQRLRRPSPSQAANHSFSLRQSGLWTMTRLTAAAPWSPRLQPAVLPMYQSQSYISVETQRQMRLEPPWLLLYEGSLLLENDVWASQTDGSSWDLIAGRTFTGQQAVLVNTSFRAHLLSANCEDPGSDAVFTMGGLLTPNGDGDNSVWYSVDELRWSQVDGSTFTPGRSWSSCDVTSATGTVLLMGGQQGNVGGTGGFLNDVWAGGTDGTSWSRQSGQAPWPARAEHLVILVPVDAILNVELLYVIGGEVSAGQVNDVWVSSDDGVTWAVVTLNAPWPARWGHSGVATSDGVLVVLGGVQTVRGLEGSLSDVWSSFDGGLTWSSCAVEATPDPFIRSEQGFALNSDEALILVSGIKFVPGQGATQYRDVWKTNWSLRETPILSDICNTPIPDGGVGLPYWPGTVAPAPPVSSSAAAVVSSSAVSSSFRSSSAVSSSTSSPFTTSSSRLSSSSSSAAGGASPASNAFMMEVMTNLAPWSARIQPAMLPMFAPVTYQSVTRVGQVTLQPPWLLLYEGSLAGFSAEVGLLVENDVWGSGDSGQTWDLLSGISQFGGPSGRPRETLSALPNSSFRARAASGNCEDPSSDRVYSLGGIYSEKVAGQFRIVATNEVWYSDDSLSWQLQAVQSFSPGRFLLSCDVNAAGHMLTMGGQTADGALLNDVWMQAADGADWTLVTLNAGWSPRSEHLVLVGTAPLLGLELLYVMGGQTSATGSSNDVWASSDGGASWSLISAAAPWGPRWGHAGVITEAGALLVIGGSNTDTGSDADTYTYREIWASFNGGLDWSICTFLPGAANRTFIRTEQGAALLSNGQLALSAGYWFNPPNPRNDSRAVWKTAFSLEDTAGLARRCNGVMPWWGAGLGSWPGAASPLAPGSSSSAMPGRITPSSSSSSSSSASTSAVPTVQPSSTGAGPPLSRSFSMTRLTAQAPWSFRIQPALLPMYSPITFQQSVTGAVVSLDAPWLILFEGTLTQADTLRNENDVWASSDGANWQLISGVSSFDGRTSAAFHPNSSFTPRGGSTNCEDPESDRIFSLGGFLVQDNTLLFTNEVWQSEDGLVWTPSSAVSFTPGRYFSSCDVTSLGDVLTMGGATALDGQSISLLNDVWSMTASVWRQVTDHAPWAARLEHLVLVADAPLLGQQELIYVMGGTVDNTNYGVHSNDVWSSSDSGYSWLRITNAAAWGPRWGHGGAATRAGVLVVIGGIGSASSGSPYFTYHDVWASLDGGLSFSPLTLAGDYTVYVRGEPGVALVGDEQLMIAAGYTFGSAPGRSDHRDVWKSSQSLSDPQAVATMAGTRVPVAGIGLPSWAPAPAPKPGSSSSTGRSVSPADGGGGGGLSGGAVAGIVLLVLVLVLGASAGGYWWYRRRVSGMGGGQALDAGWGGSGMSMDLFGPRSGAGSDRHSGSLLGGNDGFGSSSSGGGRADYYLGAGQYTEMQTSTK